MDTPQEFAYLAGIIDGEGSIYIGNFSKNKKTGALYYQTNMEVTNTDESLMKWLTEKFGGRIHKYTEKQTPKNSRKPIYRWIVTSDLLTYLCQQMLPYLIIKKRQCWIMIQMRNTYTKSNYVKGHKGTQPISEYIMKMRKSLFDEMRSLHCRNYNK
jgi:hypothetical protein